jgi:hypothetical protein
MVRRWESKAQNLADSVRSWFAGLLQHHPGQQVTRVVLIAVLAAAVLVLIRPLWRWATRYVITAVHEAGHAVAAIGLTGRLRAVRSMRLRADTSGVTWSATGAGLRSQLVTMAGYPAPGALGAVGMLLIVGGQPRSWLWGLLILAVIEGLLWVRNLFGLLLILMWSAALVELLQRGSLRADWYAGATVAAVLVMGGLRSVVELLVAGRDPIQTWRSPITGPGCPRRC